MNTKEADKKYVMGTYGRYDLELTHGKGSTVFSGDGKKYIDFGSGIAVNTFGFADSEYVEAVCGQLKKLQHTSNYYYTEPCARLAEALCTRTGMSRVFFSNSGAEANECAIKAARKYGTDRDAEKNVIVTLKNSFHGRTVTTLSATGQDVFHHSFTPFTEGFVYVEAGNIAELRAAAENNKCCAIMMEMIQGEGGVIQLEADFVNEAAKIAKEHDMLIVVDEVQTGNGRTGKLYAYEHFGLKPDIVTTAKGLAGGLPIGATMFSERVEKILTPGSHGSTFGGNPVSCAAALNVLSRIDGALMARITEKSGYIASRLRKMNGVTAVSGMGYMLGASVEGDAHEIAAKCLENGLLILTAKDKLRLLPALNITDAEFDEGLEILENVMAKFSRKQ